MSSDVTTTGAVVAHHSIDEGLEHRTLLVGTRLFLAANTMLMLAMLFTYIYLRGNNWNGMWRPSGIEDIPSISMAIVLILQAACLVVVVAALGNARRGGAFRTMALIGLVLGLAALAARIWYQFNLGSNWIINNGTYVATSMLWLGLLIAEVFMGCLWLMAIAIPSQRAADGAVGARHLRAFTEYWCYLLVLSTLVFLLIRLV